MSQPIIQATRSAAAAGASAIIASNVRVYSLSVASDGGGAGILELTTTSNSGDTIIYVDVPTGEVLHLILEVVFYFQKEFIVKLKPT